MGMDVGVFEVISGNEGEDRRQFEDRLLAQVQAVIEPRFLPFLAEAKDLNDFRSRFALVREDIFKVAQQHLQPKPWVMRRIEGSLKAKVPSVAAAANRDRTSSQPHTGATSQSEVNASTRSRRRTRHGAAAQPNSRQLRATASLERLASQKCTNEEGLEEVDGITVHASMVTVTGSCPYCGIGQKTATEPLPGEMIDPDHPQGSEVGWASDEPDDPKSQYGYLARRDAQAGTQKQSRTPFVEWPNGYPGDEEYNRDDVVGDGTPYAASGKVCPTCSTTLGPGEGDPNDDSCPNCGGQMFNPRQSGHTVVAYDPRHQVQTDPGGWNPNQPWSSEEGYGSETDFGGGKHAPTTGWTPTCPNCNYKFADPGRDGGGLDDSGYDQLMEQYNPDDAGNIECPSCGTMVGAEDSTEGPYPTKEMYFSGLVDISGTEVPQTREVHASHVTGNDAMGQDPDRYTLDRNGNPVEPNATMTMEPGPETGPSPFPPVAPDDPGGDGPPPGAQIVDDSMGEADQDQQAPEIDDFFMWLDTQGLQPDDIAQITPDQLAQVVQEFCSMQGIQDVESVLVGVEDALGMPPQPPPDAGPADQGPPPPQAGPPDQGPPPGDQEGSSPPPDQDKSDEDENSEKDEDDSKQGPPQKRQSAAGNHRRVAVRRQAGSMSDANPAGDQHQLGRDLADQHSISRPWPEYMDDPETPGGMQWQSRHPDFQEGYKNRVQEIFDQYGPNEETPADYQPGGAYHTGSATGSGWRAVNAKLVKQVMAHKPSLDPNTWQWDGDLRLYTSSGENASFTCPDCNTHHASLGFNRCGDDCGRVWASWAVRGLGPNKTATSQLLFCREVDERPYLLHEAKLKTTAEGGTIPSPSLLLYQDQKGRHNIDHLQGPGSISTVHQGRDPMEAASKAQGLSEQYGLPVFDRQGNPVEPRQYTGSVKREADGRHSPPEGTPAAGVRPDSYGGKPAQWQPGRNNYTEEYPNSGGPETQDMGGWYSDFYPQDVSSESGYFCPHCGNNHAQNGNLQEQTESDQYGNYEVKCADCGWEGIGNDSASMPPSGRTSSMSTSSQVSPHFEDLTNGKGPYEGGEAYCQNCGTDSVHPNKYGNCSNCGADGETHLDSNRHPYDDEGPAGRHRAAALRAEGYLHGLMGRERKPYRLPIDKSQYQRGFTAGVKDKGSPEAARFIQGWRYARTGAEAPRRAPQSFLHGYVASLEHAEAFQITAYPSNGDEVAKDFEPKTPGVPNSRDDADPASAKEYVKDKEMVQNLREDTKDHFDNLNRDEDLSPQTMQLPDAGDRGGSNENSNLGDFLTGPTENLK